MNTKRRAAVSVVVIAFAFGLNLTGISPILGILTDRYEQYGTGTIQLLQTIPYLLVMAGAPIAGWLTAKIRIKSLVMTGLLVIGVCGVIPCFTESFVVLFATRVLIGLGFGIISPLNTAIIAQNFPPQERALYMGFHVVGMGLGNMVGNLAGGIFAGVTTQMFFLVYGVAFLAMAVVAVMLASAPPASVTAEKSAMKLNRDVYVISIGSFLHTLFINAYSTNIGIYIFDHVTEDPGVSGTANAINAAAALVVGLLFGQISKRLGKYTLPFSIFIASVGFGGLLLVGGMPGVILASLCCGVSISCFMACGSYLISIFVHPEAVAKASGCFSLIGGIGGMIAPVFMSTAAAVTTGSDSADGQFLVACVGMTLFGVVATFMVLAKFKKDEAAAQQ